MGRPQENMNIRLAAPVDIEAVADIGSTTHDSPSRRSFLDAAIRAGECWIVERDGMPLGFAVLQYSFYGNGFVPLLIVRSEYRRQGVGRALLEHLARTCGTSKLFTSTNESNVAMRSLLASTAFEPSGIIHNLDPGDPELVFFRIVRPSPAPTTPTRSHP